LHSVLMHCVVENPRPNVKRPRSTEHENARKKFSFSRVLEQLGE
jgi:hypothetical protein